MQKYLIVTLLLGMLLLVACNSGVKSGINIKVWVNGPQTLKDGATYEIRWKSVGAPEGSKVGISVLGLIHGEESWGYGVGPDGSAAPLPPALPASGSLKWVARNSPGNTEAYRVSGSLYIPGAEHYNYPTLAQSRSATFNIEVPGGPRSIAIVTPKEGAVLQTGQTYQVSWASTAVPSQATIHLELRSEGTSPALGGAIIGETKNTGAYEWHIPSDIEPGTYTIWIAWMAEYGIYNAQNESERFRIVASSGS